MLLTRASEYALLSLIVLARNEAPVDVDTLSKELDISKSFLAKILQSLAKADIIKSFKGAHGGFAMNAESMNSSLLHILSAVEAKTPSVFDCSNNKEDCPSNQASSCSLWPILNRLQGKIDTFLDSLTLADIIKE